MASLVDFVVRVVRPAQYYENTYSGIRWSSGGEGRVLCPFHDEKTPSLHVNRDTGKWHCHGCDESGRSIVSHHAKREDVSHTIAAEQLYERYVHPVIPERMVYDWARDLRQRAPAIRYLVNERCLSPDVIKHYKLGWLGKAITIPVPNEFGYYVNAKLYMGPNAQPKMLNYSTPESRKQGIKYGSPPMLFPLDAFALAARKGYIIVCEGEWDALALLSMGVPAITCTGGCKSWAPQYNERFRGLHVYVAYDNDKDGERYDSVVARNLRNDARSIKRIRIPRTRGRKDVLDWIRTSPVMRRAKGWERVLLNAKSMGVTNEALPGEEAVHDVTVMESSHAKYAGRRIRMDALVCGKVYPVQILPKKWRCTCAKTCNECPIAEAQADFIEVDMQPDDPRLIDMATLSKDQLKAFMFRMAKMNPKPGCYAQVEEVERINVERLSLRPALDATTGTYTPADGYYIGHGLPTNRTYRFDGRTLPHPVTRGATHLLTKAVSAQGEVEAFEMTPDLNRQLRVFRPRGRLNSMAQLSSIADWMAEHVTRIWQRPDLHIIVDLVFHSVDAFDFNGERVPRGMLDVLVLGDTRTGKGFVTEGLLRYYRLGEIASGENCSFAGLVGGCQQLGTQWIVTWGAIPLNHGRLVVIDETSSLSHDEIGRMSRVRSEGVAEITKIVSEKTRAQTRLLWLGNPRDGRPLMEHNTGIEAVKGLIGANEDISRFDLILTLSHDEVPEGIINAPAHPIGNDQDKYPASLCRSLLLWAWSRRPDQIVFTKRATESVLQTAMEFSQRFSPRIPLVQSENIRIKLAKIAAAIAARCYSADATGERLEVHYGHVLCARQVLLDAYRKPSMAYDQYSERAIAATKMRDPDKVREVVDAVDVGDHAVLRGLIELPLVTSDRLADYVGDDLTAKQLISELVRLNCLQGTRGGYGKTQAFNEWLRRNYRKAAR